MGARGTIPSMEWRVLVGRYPTRPQQAAGIRQEPLVSVPIAKAAMPSATDTAPPDVEPPAIRPMSRPSGESGVPKWGLRPNPE